MRSSFQRPGSALLIAVLAVVGAGPAQAAVVNWIGGSSFWDLVTNWGSNPLLPGAADDVVINAPGAQTVTYRSGTNTVNSLTIVGDDALAVTGGSLTVANSFSAGAATSISAGTLTLNGASTMASLALSGGVLGGTGSLVVGGASSWLAGTQTGTGTTRYDGALALSGLGAKVLSGGRTVTLNGTTTWSGNTAANNGALQFAGGTLNNAGTFNDQNGFASFIDHGSGTNAFNNIGTYNKQSNTRHLGRGVLQQHRHDQRQRRDDADAGHAARAPASTTWPRVRRSSSGTAAIRSTTRRSRARAPSSSARRTSAPTPS